ncbi:arf-GAP domain and FG repeat-containing protein 1 isoform X2 [Malaya genurostris]|uniref:arf-GAP domain and FG repeat-containing protein 1 isoform X2 n=1 Tax=Malaya genurostris TaxID=325434 RepID=UPI0026F38CB6|nr:arf-GAP domain and FG repeat-containing protein 1 isoform X2 [Malaya genurostris]
MAVVRKKQDDKILKTLRELVGIGGNKQCFDCGQKGPTYINMTIGSFVCTTCSGILRGLTPPHRVKSISMATFTQEEIDFVRQNGNDACSRTWLGLWDPKRAIKQEHRDFMIDKYERKRYYLEPASPLKSLSTNTSSSTSSLPSSNGFSSSSSNISSRNGTENVVPLKTVTLTPPSTLRLCRTNSTSSNVLNGNGSHLPSVTSSSTSLKFQQQFSPDDSNFFSEPPKILPPTPQKHSNNHHQRLNGTVNGANFERNQRNGLLTSTSNGNKFTPDSDFVADFSNANIVNVNGSANGSSGLKNNNNNKLSNGFNEKGNLCNGHQNGNGEQSNSDMENFADFEHNTIYNAAEHLSGSIFSNGIDSSTTNSSSSTTSVNSMNNDLFINNYSLLNNNNSTNSTDSVPVGVSGGDFSTCNNTQFTAFGEYKPNTYVSSPYSGANVQRSNGYICFQNNYPNGGSNSLSYTTNQNCNVPWNLWNNFNQWPPNEQTIMFGSANSLSCAGQSQQPAMGSVRHHHHQQQQNQQQRHCSNQNRWSVPISASSKSATASISTAPSVDRYAALKDLDDQLREIKLECETNNNNIVNASTANPFKSANPFQQPQQHQQHQQQQQSLNWTIPGSTSSTGTTTNGFYGTSPYQNGFTHANYINGNAPNGIGFSNSFHQPSSNAYGSAGIGSQVAPQFNSAAVGSVHQPLNHFGHFGNPFVTAGATTAVSNSNNPFL